MSGRLGFKLSNVWFVLRNWRYHRLHKAVLVGLRDAVRDEPPRGVDYTVEVNGPAVDVAALELLKRDPAKYFRQVGH